MTWTDHEFTEGLDGVTPTGLAPLPNGRFMATTRSCSEPTADGTQRAYSVDPDSGSMTRLADPPNLEHRYAPIEIDDQLLYLGSFHPALMSYQPASDRWFTGALLDLDGAAAVSDTPLVGHDDRVVIVSTGLVDADTRTCCTPTADAWITDLPTAATSGTTAPTTGAGYTPLALSEPPEGYRLVSAKWGTGSGGGGSAVYTNPDTSNRLEIVSTQSDRRPPTVTAPGQATWKVGRHNVTASSETGCSHERCGIVLQWDTQHSQRSPGADPRAASSNRT